MTFEFSASLVNISEFKPAYTTENLSQKQKHNNNKQNNPPKINKVNKTNNNNKIALVQEPAV